ncbi:hypothetical protein HHK36_030652 [Tetracentron sinense]|uniref:Beta-hydroxyacyl-ACP dehydratase n=1 Tax=Tetracentron sinense TaxID=13715 RepID=A0A835CYW0_TETSI|nr:hypothetical protein HHK36_030652 [Tetracentron sinense]
MSLFHNHLHSAFVVFLSSSSGLIVAEYPAFPTVMDIKQIREILPHRVMEYNPGVSAVVIKNVTINDNFFPGNFPERPIMPGVLMVEGIPVAADEIGTLKLQRIATVSEPKAKIMRSAMAQVGGLVMLQPEVGGSRENFFFAGIDKVRFRKPVIAGDTLVMRMTLIKLQKCFGIQRWKGRLMLGVRWYARASS